jgi:hypothetical protein
MYELLVGLTDVWGSPLTTHIRLQGRCARIGVSVSTVGSGPTRRKFTPEFKAEIVARVEASGGKIAQVAHEIPLHDWSCALAKVAVDAERNPP